MTILKKGSLALTGILALLLVNLPFVVLILLLKALQVETVYSLPLSLGLSLLIAPLWFAFSEGAEVVLGYLIKKERVVRWLSALVSFLLLALIYNSFIVTSIVLSFALAGFSVLLILLLKFFLDQKAELGVG